MALSAPFLWGKVFETMKFENAEKAAHRKFTKPLRKDRGRKTKGKVFCA